jgi:anti-sigma regulatory factor (Ser/Thr protein kinase)
MHSADDFVSAPAAEDLCLLPTHPPSTFVLERAWVLDSPEQLSALRAAILAVIAGDGSTVGALDDIAENMVLIASELATNALKYAYPPTVVSVLREDDTYLLDVADHAPATAPYVAMGRPAGHGGLGMQIARRLALDVGWYANGAAKHVWAILPGAA